MTYPIRDLLINDIHPVRDIINDIHPARGIVNDIHSQEC
jgi:hypothetical protein